MDIAKILSDKYLASVLESFGLELGPDLVFRKWNAEHNLCATVEVRQLSGKRYTVELGFFSPFICRCFELRIPELPRPWHCTAAGIFYRIDEFLGRKLCNGWEIDSLEKANHVGRLFQEALISRLGELFQRFMEIEGWIGHFRSCLDKQTAGRGYPWSMLGYALLSSDNTTLQEIETVIDAHARDDSARRLQNRIDIHIERQGEMVRKRYGKQVRK